MMQPVYINHIASIHADTASGESPYLSANEPDYKSIITNVALRRRMSRIIKMGVACGLECISTLPSEKVHAIITATGLGCLADTEKFLNTIIENEEQLLNPTPFIQSTFNTIGAQIALLRQIHAYNMTYVHRGLSFESALLDGMMRIWEGDENVLVGAIDEITPNSHAIQQRLGLGHTSRRRCPVLPIGTRSHRIHISRTCRYIDFYSCEQYTGSSRKDSLLFAK